jgi:putative hemolysin
MLSTEQKVNPFEVATAGLNPISFLMKLHFESRLKSYRPRVSLRLENTKYLIKTAENEDEIQQVLRLRHEVFYRELMGRSHSLTVDVDRFDMRFDHMLVIDKETGRCAGTYRLNIVGQGRKPYSASEFVLDKLMLLPGTKLEIGRACVHPDYRKTALFIMLWKGITAYMQKTGSRFLFGCSSMHSTDKETIARAYRYLLVNGHCRDDLGIRPQKKHEIRRLGRYVEFVDLVDKSKIDGGRDIVPPLVHFYLKCGAKICGEPALDKKMECADFLTLLDRQWLSASIRGKFFG